VNANETLLVRLHSILHQLRNREQLELAEHLADAMITWQRTRMQEIRQYTDWLDEMARDLPGSAPPKAPSEYGQEVTSSRPEASGGSRSQ
jgi:hypothetical protein